MARKLAPRDTWPEIRVTFLPLPWTWRRPKIYRDDVDPWLLAQIEIGPLMIEWGGQEGGWRDQFIGYACDRCHTDIARSYAIHSGGLCGFCLCGFCLADNSLLPLTRIGTP